LKALKGRKKRPRTARLAVGKLQKYVGIKLC